jgi:hypothetical protein
MLQKVGVNWRRVRIFTQAHDATYRTLLTTPTCWWRMDMTSPPRRRTCTHSPWLSYVPYSRTYCKRPVFSSYFGNLLALLRCMQCSVWQKRWSNASLLLFVLLVLSANLWEIRNQTSKCNSLSYFLAPVNSEFHLSSKRNHDPMSIGYFTIQE